MLKCMIGDYYDYYINKYATNRVFYLQGWKYYWRSIYFFGQYTWASTNRLYKFFKLFNGRIEEGT